VKNRTVKRVGVIVLLVLATITWTVGIVAVWAQRQALNTDNWVHTSDRLLQNEQIRTALATTILERVYASAPVETQLRDRLPDNLKPLAAPISAGLREVASRNAPKILGSAAALKAWEVANRNAHKTLLKLLDGKLAKNGTVTLNLHDLIAQVAAGTGLPPGAADKLPANLQSIQVFKSNQLEAAQKAVHALRTLSIVLVIVSVLLLAGAIALSDDRRRTVISCAGCIIFAGFFVLAARRLGSNVGVNALADGVNATPAVRATLAIGTSLLADAAWGSIVFGVLLATGAWLVGSGRRATALRRVSYPALRDHVVLVGAGLGFLILLLVIWGPVPWTRSFWPLIVFTIAAFIWLELVRRRTVVEFGPGDLPDPIAPAVHNEPDSPERERHPV
jgi:hypothetical protein